MRLIYTLLALVFIRLDARKARRAEKASRPFVQKRAKKAPGAVRTALLAPFALLIMGVESLHGRYAAFRASRRGKPALVKRSRLVAGGVAMALIGGTVAAGAQAAPVGVEPGVNAIQVASADAQIRASQIKNQSNSDDLVVTVGKTVAQTTDQSGNATPLSIFLVNGQVSGQGSGDVTIPMGPNGDKVVDVNSNSGQVQNFTDFGGFYHEDLPVTVQTKATVNGEEIDPVKGYNLTGDVEIQYIFTNHTSRPEQITFEDLDGNSQTKTVDIPVPFGVSFSAGFGQGWDVVEAPNMSIATNPTATNLASTVVLFPIIQGAVGGTTQTLTVKARAQNAALPGTLSQAVPINLATYMGGVAMQVNPALQGDLLSPAQGLIGEIVNPIMDAGRLISGFIGAFETVNNEYVDPILADIQNYQVDPEAVASNLDELGVGLRALATVQQANRNADYELARIVKELANVVAFDGPKLVKFLETLIKDVGGDAGSAADALKDLQQIFQDLNPEQFVQDVESMNATCATVSPAVDHWGAGPLTIAPIGYIRSIPKFATGNNPVTIRQYLNGDSGADANGDFPNKTALGGYSLGNAIAAMSGSISTWDIEDVSQLLVFGGIKSDQPAAWPLREISDQLSQTLGKGSLPNSLTQLAFAAGLGTGGQEVAGLPLSQLLTQPLCETLGLVLQDQYLDLITKYWPTVQKYLPELIQALEFLDKVANNPNLAKWERFLDTGFNVIANALDKPCRNSDVIDPLLAAAKKAGGFANLENPSVLIPLALEILKSCGVAQVLEVLGDANKLVGDLAGEFADFVDDLINDLPRIIAAAGGLQELAGGVRTLLNTAPGQINQLLGQVEGGVLKLEGEANSGIEDISSYAAQLGATLEAMNARTLAGDGDPYGKATGPGTSTVTVYQITQEAAQPYASSWLAGVGLALVFLLLAVGLGTVLYRRRRNY